MSPNLQKLMTDEQMAWIRQHHPEAKNIWEALATYLPPDFPPSRKVGAQVGRKAHNKKKL